MRVGRFRFSLVTLFLWLLGGAIIAFALYGSFLTLVEGRIQGNQWQNLIVAGVALGSVYALIALGYTLVYGILFMINFAHGEVFMWGAFTAFFAASALNDAGMMEANPILAFFLVLGTAMLVSMIVAIMLERVAYRPLRGAPRLVPLISAIGADTDLVAHRGDQADRRDVGHPSELPGGAGARVRADRRRVLQEPAGGLHGARLRSRRRGR